MSFPVLAFKAQSRKKCGNNLQISRIGLDCFLNCFEQFIAQFVKYSYKLDQRIVN